MGQIYEGEWISIWNDVAALETKLEAIKRALAELVPLAQTAMREANNDGAEYDIEAELADAKALLAAQQEEQ